MALTDKQLKSLQADGRRRKYSDAGGVPGLYIEVSPTGRKWWRLKFRMDGKERLLALGVYPDVSLKDARQRALAARQMIAAGIDPVQARSGGEGNVHRQTFGRVAWDWFERNRGQWTAEHGEKIKKRLEGRVLPVLGEQLVESIQPCDVLELCRGIEGSVSAYMAHSILGLVSRVCRYAVASGLIPSDPCRDIAGALRPHRYQHMPAITDPVRVGELAAKIDAYQGMLTTRAAMQLMLLCMCRTGEIRGMRWEEIDWRDNVWRIPAERMKMRRPHIVPLSRQAVAILAGLYALTGKNGGCFVFPSYCRDKYFSPMGKNTINNALRAMGYNARELVGHGFRSVASTLLNEQGWAPDVIETQLAHAPADSVRAAYNRAAWLDDRRRMLQAWADYLDQLKAQAGRS
ncbi:MAG: integrase [Oscillospiraceae bacterium]|nr:MAG: integrase [Oscillospiraceae bacterium]